MGSRFRIAGSAVLLATLLGCAAQIEVTPPSPPPAPPPPSPSPSSTLGAIRGTLQLGQNGNASSLASAQGGGGARSDDSFEDAVIYIEALPSPLPGPEPAGTNGAPDTNGHGTAEADAAKGASPATRAKSAPSGKPVAAKPAAPGAAKTSPTKQDAPPVIAETGAAAASTNPALVTMGQANHKFLPRVLAIPAGTTVHFQNRDRVYQNVFSISPAKKFDVGKYPPGQSRSVKFDTPGVVQLYCDIDPSMAGFIVVVPNQYFTKPDAAGAFEITHLPRGPYTLKVWHPRLGKLTQRVVLPHRDDASVALSY
jgi:plastocyanin